jgi:NAD-dependent deacetylase
MTKNSPGIDSYQRIVFLTGAGISAALGIRTYRGPEGLWNDATLVRLSDGETFRTDPLAVWNFWSEARRLTADASPNAAHLAISALERRLRPGQSLTLITMNIDGLHGRAGSSNVVEFHGNVHRTRCSRQGCGLEPFMDPGLHVDAVPLCPVCGSNLRPDIVLFHEMIPPANSAAAGRAVMDCDLFIVVGSSCTVSPANGFVRKAFLSGARTVYVNLEGLGGDSFEFREEYLGKAEEILPLFLAGRLPMTERASSELQGAD